MKNKCHPFKRIQVVEDLCKIIEEVPVAESFDWVDGMDLGSDGWDSILCYISIMYPQLKELADGPLTQLCLLQMIDSVPTQQDHLWDCLGNIDRNLYRHYRDSFLHMSDLETILPRDYGIDILF
jgi:hypothetical protein